MDFDGDIDWNEFVESDEVWLTCPFCYARFLQIKSEFLCQHCEATMFNFKDDDLDEILEDE